jgi:hypothetical protein
MEEKNMNLLRDYPRIQKGTIFKVKDSHIFEVLGVWWQGYKYHGFDVAIATATAKDNKKRKHKFLPYETFLKLNIEAIEI